MYIFKNGIDLQSKLKEYIRTSQSLYIFSPYIKLETLKALIEGKKNVKAVFVRWEPKDLILGSSDIEIYPYLKEKGIVLFRNPRIHLKAYLDDYKNCFLTTANISSRALNIPSFSNYNYEIGTIVENLGFEDRYYFQLIESESLLITDNIYKQIKEQLLMKATEFPNELDFQFKFEKPDKDFLISALPLTSSVETLIKIYKHHELASETELNCILHDLAIYNIPLGLSEEQVLQKLTEAFFSHNFIKCFLDFLETKREIYFGEAKQWIHNNCANVPLPRKWEITENIQILYSWIVSLGEGKYEIDRPNHSERLFIV